MLGMNDVIDNNPAGMIEEKDIHNLGEFDNVYDAMRRYPAGGVSGDYITILGVKHFWNVNRMSWGILKDKEDNLVQMVEDAIGKFSRIAKGGRTVFIFKAADVRPDMPVGGSWNPDDNTVVYPEGWSGSSPADGFIWMSVGIFESDGSQSGEWSEPACLSATNANELDRILKELTDEVFPLSFRSFSGGGMFETGRTVIPVISWMLERKDEEVQPERVTVNGSAEGIAGDLKSYTGVPVTEDASYHVVAGNDSQSVEKTATCSFRFMKYWGVSEKTVLDNADILTMEHSFATAKTMGRTTFNCTGGKYPYYILPSELALNVEVWINGFRNTDLDMTDLEVTNPFNVRHRYRVIRLNNIQTGILNIEFK